MRLFPTSFPRRSTRPAPCRTETGRRVTAVLAGASAMVFASLPPMSPVAAAGQQDASPALPERARGEESPPPPPKDRYLVTWAPKRPSPTTPTPAAATTTTEAPQGSAAGSPAPAEAADATAPRTSPAGRLILFLVPDSPRFASAMPADGPFFRALQPIASIPVGELADGAVVEFDFAKAASFRGAFEELDGAWRVQAVLDSDFTERGHLGPGNLVSQPITVELASDRADEVRLELTDIVPPRATPPGATADGHGVVWIERRSELLSRHFGREFRMRAGVVLPYGYHDRGFPRRMWPAIYVVGGFGANHLAAIAAAPALQSSEARAAVPQAAWIYLDADTPWGHSGFVDSDANGPIGRALVEEFIPFLEERFRLIATPEARIVTGHSSGGWTAVHLAITYPDVFGAAFASAPDPVDFSAFQSTDLYRDPSLFVSSDGSDTPSYRGILGPNDDRVFMTVRDEVASERAIDPDGRGGGQWAAWEAMWSPLDPTRRAPRRLFDPDTGAIDATTVAAWSRHDIAQRLERDPDRIGPILDERVRIVCGTRDSYYLNRAGARLGARLAAWRARGGAAGATSSSSGGGSIELVDGLTHDTIYQHAQLRFGPEMIAHFRRHGLGEAPYIPGGGRATSDDPRENGAASGQPRRDDRPVKAPTPSP